jgi:hypothetical protein
MLFGVHKKLFDTFLTYDNCKMEGHSSYLSGTVGKLSLYHFNGKTHNYFKMKYKIVI